MDTLALGVLGQNRNHSHTLLDIGIPVGSD